MMMDPIIAALFWAKVDCSDLDGCWIWTGARQSNGYGHLRSGGIWYLAHRFAYILEHGAIPEGCKVLHSCDMPLCCKPGHLSAGSQQENVDQMWERQRARIAPHDGANNPNAKLTPEQVLMIRQSSLSGAELGRRLGVTGTTIQYARKGKAWASLELV